MVGDANIDFKNFRSTDKNYVPTQVHKNGFGTVALTDNWFACVSGDDILPDLFIGRIPANAGNQVEYAVNKILAYEEEDYSEWHSRAVFAADDDYPEFQEISDNLIEKYFPDYFDNEKIYLKTIYNDANVARNDLITYISEGSMVTHYSGHGQVEIWGSYRNPDTGISGRLFSRSYVKNLTNIDKPTFMVTLTCNNGYFSYSTRGDSLAETMLLTENKGAFACFASTTLGNTGNHGVLSQSLFDAIFNQRETVLGDATLSAKISAYYSNGADDIVQCFVLFGDPATVFKIKPGPPAPKNPTPEDGENSVSQTPTLKWETGDPSGEPVVYDVYFGGSGDIELVSAGQAETTYNPGELDFSTAYYWKVKAKNPLGESSVSPVWDFTIQEDPNATTTTTTSIQPTPSSTTTTSNSTSTIVSSSTTTSLIPIPPTTSTTSSINSTTTTTITTTTSTIVPEIMCPLTLALDGKVKDINLLRRVRDEIIDRGTFGEEYIKLYYQHYIEVSLILIEDQNIRDRVATLVRQIILSVPSYLEEKRLDISQEMPGEIMSLLDLVEQRSRPALKADIRIIRQEIEKGEIFKRFNMNVVPSR